MRRVSEVEKEPVWGREVDVRLTVGELATISALLGKTGAGDKRSAVDAFIGEYTYTKIISSSGKADFGRELYEETANILREEGVL